MRTGVKINNFSSSFIIAKHESFNIKDLKDALYNMYDDIKWLLINYGNYICFEDNERIQYLLKANQIDEAVYLAVYELEDKLYLLCRSLSYGSLVLDYWECSYQEFNDNNGDFLGYFFMYLKDKFKCDTLRIG